MTEETATTPTPALEPAWDPEVAPETPEVEGDQPAPEAPEAPELPEAAEADQPAEPTEPETVEVEVNGSTYRVPKELESSILMHADYTRKTQEIADKGRELEAEREKHVQQVQTHREHLQDFGQLSYLDGVLKQFRDLNWQEVQQQDPEKAQEWSLQYQIARDQREQIVERLQKREHEAGLQAQREHAKRKEQLQVTLARDIPNYSTETQAKMTDTAVRHGFSQDEVNAVVDPRYMKILHLAHLGEQVLKRQAAATKPKPSEPAKPLPKAAGGPPPSNVPRDKDSVEDWMKRRNQELRRRA